MFDLKMILEKRDEVLKNLENQNVKELDGIDTLIDLDKERKELIALSENLRAEQNKKSKQMPVVMKNGTDEEKKQIRDELKELSEKVKSFQPQVKEVEEKMNAILLTLPNTTLDSTPFGKGEDDNKEIRMYGEKRDFAFEPKEHFDLCGEGIDFERGAKLSGARFVVYRSKMAQLERAVMNFMLDTHGESGYSEVVSPVLVSRETMTGSGQLPKFEDDAFKTSDDMFLIPTAEVPLINLHRGEILDEKDLPACYMAYTPCFRREAGSYGKDTKGIIRLHQFNKVELIKFTRPEDGETELEKLLANAESILQKLGLHYRVVELCTGDIGFSAARTYDIEVWLPGQQRYREISSCSTCTDFQARRANIRMRRTAGGKPEFVHTLNGSGLAIDRTLVAILENYQQEDGSIVVPEVLRPYMNGCETISL